MNRTPTDGIAERLQKVSAELLLIKMRDYSENMFCAGWLHGLEFRLWELATACGTEAGMSKEECHEYLQLAYDAGGWWTLPLGAGINETLMPLAEWEAKYVARERGS